MPWRDWRCCGGHRRMPCIHLPRWHWPSRRSWWCNCCTYVPSHGPHRDTGRFVCHIRHQLSHGRHKDKGRTHHPPRNSHRHTRHSLATLGCRDTFRRRRWTRCTRLDRWCRCGRYTRIVRKNHPFHVDCQSSQVHIDRNVRQCNLRHTHKSRSGQLHRRNETWMGLIMCSLIKLQ